MIEIDNQIDKIVLIDDEESVNFLHRLIFKKTGIGLEITDFRNAETALEYLRTLPDNEEPLIFLDINMPMMDGWDFLNSYKAKGLSHKLNAFIVMLTSSIDPLDKEKASHYKEVKAFRTKPLTIEMINELLNQNY